VIEVTRIPALRSQIGSWRAAADRIGFVPTMGNLHAGHLALVAAAAQHSDRVVVSIFVNPTQFGPGEDLNSYPQSRAEDAAILQQHHCDCLFVPEIASVYPGGADDTTTVNVPAVSQGLCGAARPGHFQGVATVVTRLFNMVQPDLAVFGQKDFQQLLVIRKLTRDLALPIEVIDVPTVRENDGLAMSSRNRYLDADQRRTAPLLYETLQVAAEQIRTAPHNHAEICRQAVADLARAGFVPEYLELRRAADLMPTETALDSLVLVVAAMLGKTRLIDNLQFKPGLPGE
jgi:pantoate--beta-alanine ligase